VESRRWFPDQTPPVSLRPGHADLRLDAPIEIERIGLAAVAEQNAILGHPAVDSRPPWSGGFRAMQRSNRRAPGN